MLVALGIPCAPEWGANEDDDNFESLYAMHFLTAVVSGVGCLLFFRLYSDAIKQPEFGAGGPYRWYVAAVGAYFYCQLAVNFVVFVTFVDTRCKHHNILVVNRVDYTGLDFCALAGVEADASCGYGSATSPACAVGAQSLRPLRWAEKGAGFQAPTAWLGDSGWRQVFPWWLSVFFLKDRSAIMREKPGDNCVWYDDEAEEEKNCDAWWTPGYPDATYAACAVVNGVDRKQLFIDDGTARYAAASHIKFRRTPRDDGLRDNGLGRAGGPPCTGGGPSTREACSRTCCSRPSSTSGRRCCGAWPGGATRG